jgi:zinc/manganese transport system ATP-binding protein
VPDLVALDAVAVSFGSHPVWAGATFTVTPGSFTAVLGPNGAGKSTLLKLLLGLIPPSSGTVRVLGQSPRRGSAEIAYVPQHRGLDPDVPIRGRDLVLLGADGTRWGFSLPGAARRDRLRQVDQAIAAVEASAYAHRPIGQLSGGEQQRLFLAQALVSQPSLLLLDEPFASLDIRNQVAIAHLVTRLARERNIGVVMVTHDINPIISIVDQVVYIARGRVAAGRPSEVVTSESLSGLYDAAVEVVTDSRGRVFVVGLEEEVAHPHGDDHAHRLAPGRAGH